MYKIIYIVLSVFFSIDLFACRLANTGYEYDKLIGISTEANSDIVNVVVPNIVQNSKKVVIYLEYVSTSDSYENIEPSELELIKNVSTSNTSLKIKPIEGYVPTIKVVWLGDICPYVGRLEVII